jgi:deoxyadenosine/deoxycytidine kinase
VYEITRYFGKNQMILVDEGPLLAAHMFAFTGATYTPAEINRFTSLVPLPDLVIYVRASVDTIVERTTRRADPPREIDVRNRALIEEYAKSAVAIFDQLTQAEHIRCRLLVVESPDVAASGYEQVVNSISQSILDRSV